MACSIRGLASASRPIFESTRDLVLSVSKLTTPKPPGPLMALSAHARATSKCVLAVTQNCAAASQLRGSNPGMFFSSLRSLRDVNIVDVVDFDRQRHREIFPLEFQCGIGRTALGELVGEPLAIVMLLGERSSRAAHPRCRHSRSCPRYPHFSRKSRSIRSVQEACARRSGRRADSAPGSSRRLRP